VLSFARQLPHILSEEAEKIILLKEKSDNVVELSTQVRTSLRFELTVDGETKELNSSELMMYRESAKREVRKAAVEAQDVVYANRQNQIVFAGLYTNIIKDHVYESKARGYISPMDAQLQSEQMPSEAIHMLMERTKAHTHLYGRYLRAKAKYLNLTTLMSYDILAPIASAHHTRTYSYAQAVELHLQAMREFDAEFVAMSQDILQSSVDAFPRKGKRGGAYSHRVKGYKERILLNHTDTLDSVYTLSHELGHGMHNTLMAHLPESVQNMTPLCLCETASVFSEYLLQDLIIKQSTPEETLQILDKKLLDIGGTIFRQIHYTDFEHTVHQRIWDDGEMSLTDYNQLWYDISTIYQDSAVTNTKPRDEAYGWMVVPHIFGSPFYCFSYAFGNILVLALRDLHQRAPDIFMDTYKSILAAGGSISPKELLGKYGVDICNQEFYDSAFAQIEQWVGEYERLVELKS
jgi:oligoendopeptidase F